jgi:hypothetical protein
MCSAVDAAIVKCRSAGCRNPTLPMRLRTVAGDEYRALDGTVGAESVLATQRTVSVASHWMKPGCDAIGRECHPSRLRPIPKTVTAPKEFDTICHLLHLKVCAHLAIAKQLTGSECGVPYPLFTTACFQIHRS